MIVLVKLPSPQWCSEKFIKVVAVVVFCYTEIQSTWRNPSWQLKNTVKLELGFVVVIHFAVKVKKTPKKRTHAHVESRSACRFVT